MLSWLRALWTDEQGDVIQNLLWIVGVSLGVLAIAAIVYSGIKALGENVEDRLRSIDTGTIENPIY